MAKVIGIDHVQLAMPPGEEAMARRFYSEVLGMLEIPKPDVLAQRGGCWFSCGTTQVHVGAEKEFVSAKKAHPALLVDDLKHFTTRLLAYGFEVHSNKPIQGYDRIFTFDPFGNRVELMQRLYESC